MARVAALDQLRGLAVLGMLVVNFLAPFDVVRSRASWLRHSPSSFGVADAFMPIFLFAAGCALRIKAESRAASAKRALALLLLAAIVYPLEDAGREPLYVLFKRQYFQALAHIGLSILWTLPVIAASARVRAAWALGSLGLHLALSAAFYHDWVYASPRSVEGGPLGFLAWSAILLAGSLARDAGDDVRRLAAWGLGLSALGYALSCLPGPRWAPAPFVYADAPAPDLFTMSQRGVSTSYVLFGTGVSLGLLALLTRARRDFGPLRFFGERALAVYVIHLWAAIAARPFLPRDASAAAVAAALLLFVAFCALLARRIELRAT